MFPAISAGRRSSRIGPCRKNHPIPVRKLRGLLASRIAAGKVLERPPSVARQLVENAIDARMKRINVHFVDGLGIPQTRGRGS